MVENGNKQCLRAKIKEFRLSQNPEQVQILSGYIDDSIIKFPKYVSAKTVLFYWPLPGEVDLRSLIEMGTKRVALPVVVGSDLILREYSPDFMSIGAYNINEPDSRAPIISPEEIDLAIIPGVAFDKRCNRLGHGKGFYDRLLPMLRCPKIGVAFDFQILDTIPVDPWDIQMDYVATESSIFQKES